MFELGSCERKACHGVGLFVFVLPVRWNEPSARRIPHDPSSKVRILSPGERLTRVPSGPVVYVIVVVTPPHVTVFCVPAGGSHTLPPGGAPFETAVALASAAGCADACCAAARRGHFLQPCLAKLPQLLARPDEGAPKAAAGAYSRTACPWPSRRNR